MHNRHVQVSIDIDGENKWKPCFTVDGVRLPTGYYFGASAATGDLTGVWTGNAESTSVGVAFDVKF